MLMLPFTHRLFPMGLGGFGDDRELPKKADSYKSLGEQKCWVFLVMISRCRHECLCRPLPRHLATRERLQAGFEKPWEKKAATKAVFRPKLSLRA